MIGVVGRDSRTFVGGRKKKKKERKVGMMVQNEKEKKKGKWEKSTNLAQNNSLHL